MNAEELNKNRAVWDKASRQLSDAHSTISWCVNNAFDALEKTNASRLMSPTELCAPQQPHKERNFFKYEDPRGRMSFLNLDQVSHMYCKSMDRDAVCYFINGQCDEIAEPYVMMLIRFLEERSVNVCLSKEE